MPNTLTAERVAEIRRWVPLLREARALGLRHTTFGPFHSGPAEHGWDMDGWKGLSADFEAQSPPKLVVRYLTKDQEWAIKMVGNLTPERVRIVLVAYGVLSDLTRTAAAFGVPTDLLGATLTNTTKRPIQAHGRIVGPGDSIVLPPSVVIS